MLDWRIKIRRLGAGMAIPNWFNARGWSIEAAISDAKDQARIRWQCKPSDLFVTYAKLKE